MKLRWLWFDYIDPALELDAKERRLVRRKSRQLSRGLRVGFNRYDLVLALAPAPFVLIPGLIIGLQIWIPRTFASFCSMMLPMWIGGWVVSAWVAQWSRQRWTNEALRSLGYDVCLKCGYWLRGLNDDVKHCPECGAERTKLAAGSESKP